MVLFFLIIITTNIHNIVIFNIDQKTASSIAIIDDSNSQLTYGELTSQITAVKSVLSRRELVFCLCDNKVGSLVGFLSLYDNKDVCLLLSSHIERGLLDTLYTTYRPSYMWMPAGMTLEFEYEVVYSSMGFSLCKTGNAAPAMHTKLSMLMTTSGTTGSPKLVRHKYGNIESNAKNVATVFNWSTEDRGIVDLPMQYTMGLNVITSHLYAGATVMLVAASLMSSLYWKFIKEMKGTNFTGVPYSYEILSKLRFQSMDLPYLHTLAEGGGKLPDAQFESFAKYADEKDKRFFATFGTTETSARLAYLPPKDATTHIGSIGTAIPEGKLSLVDENGIEITSPNVEGELCYEGPNVTMGYGTNIKDLQKDDEFCGTYFTGDIAQMDTDGYFYIVGRKKRFLKLFGLRVSLDQSEKIIKDAFNIECACVGDDKVMRIYINDDELSCKVKCLMSEKTGLMAKCFDVIVVDMIPRLENGKINYRLLNSNSPIL